MSPWWPWMGLLERTDMLGLVVSIAGWALQVAKILCPLDQLRADNVLN